MKKIVIAIDSFKGCLSSAEAGQAAAQGVHDACPECEIMVFPVADGGEGILEVLISATHGKRVALYAHDPLMNRCKASYGISGDRQTAFIEMAAISGLPLVPKEKQNPMLTTTYGTGELIHHALECGCKKFIIGLGGSATNDAGLGMLQALGFRFLDKDGKEVANPKSGIGMCGALLPEVVTIDSSSIHPALKECHFIGACDVRNPFFGPDGAAYVYAPQKGADKQMTEKLDKALRHIAKVIVAHTGKDFPFIPGAGAAGGMGGGLLAFLNTELKSGIELLLESLHFTEKIKGADWIITGEGKSDRQTMMGKVPLGILNEAQKQNIPVLLLAGSIEDIDELNRAGFQGVFSIIPTPISLEQAMKSNVAIQNIRKTTQQICRIIQCGKR